MITRKMIFDGYYKGLIRLIESPHDDGVVCQIGNNWFYFGGLTANECKTVEEYKSSVDTKIILDEIYSVLDDFKNSGEEYQDEYSYYESYLKEKGIKEMKNVKELTKEELNELKSNYFYSHLDNDNSNQCDGYDAPWDIPDEIIFEEYEGITFVKEDFSCNLTDNHNITEEELTMKEIVKEINKYCNEYLNFVENVGNECAYTDSIVECIIKKAKELKNKYDEEV